MGCEMEAGLAWHSPLGSEEGREASRSWVGEPPLGGLQLELQSRYSCALCGAAVFSFPLLCHTGSARVGTW